MPITTQEYIVKLTPKTEANLKAIMAELGVDEGNVLSRALELLRYAVEAKDKEVSLKTPDGHQKLFKIS